jgi:hypothetical protein
VRKEFAMAYTLKGTYAGICNCKLVCPCNVDGTPTGKGDQCHGLIVYDVREGNLDDVDLSGVLFALGYFLPSNPSAGNWELEGTIDEGASEEQAGALDRILSGQEGGPFADFSPLIGKYSGLQRGQISLSDGDAPSGSVSGIGDFSAEFFKDAQGTTTTLSNAMFGFAPIIRLGKSSSSFTVFGESWDASYAEGAEYEYSSG